MAPPAVVCPRCHSEQIHKTGQALDLSIYACDGCKAQFTVQAPRVPKPTTR